MTVAGDEYLVVVHPQRVGQHSSNGFVVFANAHARHEPIVPDERVICATIGPKWLFVEISSRLVELK